MNRSSLDDLLDRAFARRPVPLSFAQSLRQGLFQASLSKQIIAFCKPIPRFALLHNIPPSVNIVCVDHADDYFLSVTTTGNFRLFSASSLDEAYALDAPVLNFTLPLHRRSTRPSSAAFLGLSFCSCVTFLGAPFVDLIDLEVVDEVCPAPVTRFELIASNSDVEVASTQQLPMSEQQTLVSCTDRKVRLLDTRISKAMCFCGDPATAVVFGSTSTCKPYRVMTSIVSPGTSVKNRTTSPIILTSMSDGHLHAWDLRKPSAPLFRWEGCQKPIRHLSCISGWSCEVACVRNHDFSVVSIGGSGLSEHSCTIEGLGESVPCIVSDFGGAAAVVTSTLPNAENSSVIVDVQIVSQTPSVGGETQKRERSNGHEIDGHSCNVVYHQRSGAVVVFEPRGSVSVAF